MAPGGPLLASKRAAAVEAVRQIHDDMVVGLGTGTTASVFIDELGKLVADGLRVSGVPTSNASAALARSVGIEVVDVERAGEIDLDVDGADEIDPRLNLLKGGGGALLREKIVARAAGRVIIIGDETKLVERLGQRPIPVEVVAFGWSHTLRHIENLTARPTIRGGPDDPFRTDSGNVILDVPVPDAFDVLAFARMLKAVTGVVEHGVFEGIASRAVIGHPDGSVTDLAPR